jgi:hypothetical protein
MAHRCRNIILGNERLCQYLGNRPCGAVVSKDIHILIARLAHRPVGELERRVDETRGKLECFLDAFK